MGSFLHFIKGVLRFVVALVVFFLFGYTELQYKAGWIVAVIVGLYLFRRGITVTSSVLVVANVGATYFSIKPLVVLTFLVLNIMILLTDEKYADDTKVIMRPYEKEVREILFRSAPSQLHLVDKMLDEHKGKEKDLVDQLKIQYKDSMQSPPPSSIKKIISTPKSTNATTLNKNISTENEISFINSHSPRSTYATVVLKIKRLLETHDRSMLGSLNRMLEEYTGREEELLQELIDEYIPEDNNNGYISTTNTTTPTTNTSAKINNIGSNFTSPNTGSYTPADVYSVSSGFPTQTSRIPPFSPGGMRASSYDPTEIDEHFLTGSGMNIQPLQVYNNGSNRHNEQQKQSYLQETQQQQPYLQETQPPSSPTKNTTTYRTGTTAANQRNLIIQQAREQARREMQARIEAQWGPSRSTITGVAKRTGFTHQG